MIYLEFLYINFSLDSSAKSCIFQAHSRFNSLSMELIMLALGLYGHTAWSVRVGWGNGVGKVGPKILK
ncbi:MAG: hypothetical protein HQL53_04090 [Magnetococcales bacterium]|nr:hypothetical protein [Magnetococcales bacterium]